MSEHDLNIGAATDFANKPNQSKPDSHQSTVTKYNGKRHTVRTS